MTAALVDLVHRHLTADRLAAAAEVVRLARAHAPDEPELQRLGALLAPLSLGNPAGLGGVERHIALGDGHRILGDRAQAAAEYQAALALERDSPSAHVGLAHLAMPGELYISWLERIYAFLQPESILELGVADGRSLATVQRPTVAIGVDPLASAMVPVSADAHIFRETSDEFFDAHRLDELLGQPLGVAFIDGRHLYEQALKDFVNVERYCGPRSLVMLHDTLPLDAATSSRARDTTFHTGDAWKIVLCLKHFRPELEVVTIATPWTGLTLVSGFTDGDSGFAARYDEAVARFIDTPHVALGDEVLTELNVVPNDWAVVRPRIEHLRSVTDEDDTELWSGSHVPTVASQSDAADLDPAHHVHAYTTTASRELLQRTHEELIHTQQQYRRVEGELLAAHEHTRDVEAALAAANVSIRRVEQSVIWQAFQRLRGRVFAVCGGGDSWAVRAIQRSLRRAGEALHIRASR